MCELCSDDIQEYELARNEIRQTAILLRRLADSYEGVANGRIDPHGREYRNVEYLAIRVIGKLSEEWL